MKGQVEKDIISAFSVSKRDASTLPCLELSVGGETDFMIGLGYNRYFPKEIFKLRSGLTIYKSVFMNASGCQWLPLGVH